MKPKVLVAGETWSTLTVHIKGYDMFSEGSDDKGYDAFVSSILPVADVNLIANRDVSRTFPQSTNELEQYAAVILSDVGANTLLLHPDTYVRGLRTPNRIHILRDYVSSGGALAMMGGYMSYQGFGARAGYRATAVAEILPVILEKGDDREEAPQGLDPKVVRDHPCVTGMPVDWPYLLGLNRLQVKPDAAVLVTAGDWPLLTVGSFGHGRTLAWASDIGPHWCPSSFVSWDGYSRLWQQAVTWLGRL